jgi:hypothetical protein
MLVAEPTVTSGDTVQISLGVRGVSPSEPIGAVELRVPTDVFGYDVIGGEILDPTAGALGDLWSAVWSSTTRLRSTEHDFFMSLFSLGASLDADFEFALLTLRIVEPEAPVVLDVGSTIARLTDDGVQSTNLGGQVIYGDPARVELPPPPAEPAPEPEPVLTDPPPPTVDDPLRDNRWVGFPNAFPLYGLGNLNSRTLLGVTSDVVLASEGSGQALAMPEPRSDLLLLLALGVLLVVRVRFR